jgi:hypothetical protein
MGARIEVNDVIFGMKRGCSPGRTHSVIFVWQSSFDLDTYICAIVNV